MTSYKIKIEQEAHADIQQGIEWYNGQQQGLGRKFHSEIKSSIEKLKLNPYFRIRYDNVRCFQLRNFPYMLYFTVTEESRVVVIRAVFHTSLNPERWTR